MKRVLVTGASGFIGRHAPALLLAKGYEVHTFSRHPLEIEGTTAHAGDMLDAGDVTRIVEEVQPTHLLHFAWIATPGVYAESPENEEWLKASVHLFEECIKAGVTRIVGSGSCFEYDWNRGACDEWATPLDATTLYGRKKAECGTILGALDVSSAWGRVFYLFGPHEPEKKLIASVIRSLVLGEEVKLTHGRQIRDFLYVEDVASAFVALLESDVEGPVNIASGKPMSIADLVTMAAAKLDRTQLLQFGAKEAPPNDPPRIEAKTDRLKEELRWTEQTGVERGLEKTIEWWKGRMEAK